jgi:hypothetical protein
MVDREGVKPSAYGSHTGAVSRPGPTFSTGQQAAFDAGLLAGSHLSALHVSAYPKRKRHRFSFIKRKLPIIAGIAKKP